MRQPCRAGFSLLEVMLATTVLLGSVIVLSHIAFVGTAHMDAAQQYAAAQLVCQARMNEMLAAALPIEEVSNQAIPELPGWGLTVKVESASQPGLLALEVTAAELPAGEIIQPTVESSGEMAAEATADEIAATYDETSVTDGELMGSNGEVTGAGKRFSLVRWIAEPEGSEPSRGLPSTGLSTPVDLPMESPVFDNTLPGESLLPSEPMPSDEAFLPEEPLPQEPSLFEEPIPGF